jgi:hypothetical protein
MYARKLLWLKKKKKKGAKTGGSFFGARFVACLSVSFIKGFVCMTTSRWCMDCCVLEVFSGSSAHSDSMGWPREHSCDFAVQRRRRGERERA